MPALAEFCAAPFLGCDPYSVTVRENTYALVEHRLQLKTQYVIEAHFAPLTVRNP
jgi:hypothetical protein